MGLDAESTDLTTRIRARRKANVAAGLVEPALPGEHTIYDTRGGIDIERVVAAADARERRAQRAPVPGGDKVVDFVYLEGEEDALRLAPEDGGEPVDAEGLPDDGHEGPALPDEVDLGPEQVDWTEEPELGPDNAEVLAAIAALNSRLDGFERAFVLIAKAISDGAHDHEALGEMFVSLAAQLAQEPEKQPGALTRLWRSLRAV